MEWNWLFFFMALWINSSLCLIQYAAQQIDVVRGKIPARHSIIPGTNQKFLYWQDFYMQVYADLFGFLWLMNAFIHLWIRGYITQWLWIIFWVVFVVSIALFLKSCLAKNHKPDWGFPAVGRISLGGISHLPYFGLQAGMGAVCFISMFTGALEGALKSALAGGAGFVFLMFMFDKNAGHFDHLKKE